MCRSLISLCHLCFERQWADATQSPVDEAQRSQQRSPAPLYTTLLLELDMKSIGICPVYSVRRTVETALRSDVNIRFAAKCRPSRFQLCHQGTGTSADREVQKSQFRRLRRRHVGMHRACRNVRGRYRMYQQLQEICDEPQVKFPKL